MKPADLSAPDYIRWAVADPRRVSLWARQNQAQVYNRLRADVLRSRVVVFDKAATEVIARVASLPPADLLRAALSARLPWPAAICIFDYAHFLSVTGTAGKTIDPDTSTDFPLLITTDETGARGAASCLGNMKITQTGAMVGLTAEPIGLRFDFSGVTAPRLDAGCRDLVATMMAANLSASKMNAEMSLDTIPAFSHLSPHDRLHVMAVLSEVMTGRPAEDAWSLGHAYLPPSFGSNTSGVDGWIDRMRGETAHIAAVGRMLTPGFSPYCAPRDFVAKDGFEPGMLTGPVMESRGTGRIILAMLAVLGESGSTVIETTRPAGARMVGPHRTAFMTVSNIRIDLSRLTVLRPRRDEPQGASQGLRIEHQVRGHWVHYLRHGAASCDHHWQPSGDTGKRQACACAAFRVWRAEHVRGSATAGYAFTSPIAVTA